MAAGRIAGLLLAGAKLITAPAKAPRPDWSRHTPCAGIAETFEFCRDPPGAAIRDLIILVSVAPVPTASALASSASSASSPASFASFLALFLPWFLASSGSSTFALLAFGPVAFGPSVFADASSASSLASPASFASSLASSGRSSCRPMVGLIELGFVVLLFAERELRSAADDGDRRRQALAPGRYLRLQPSMRWLASISSWWLLLRSLNYTSRFHGGIPSIAVGPLRSVLILAVPMSKEMQRAG